jgi:hypothetical protein
MATLVKYCLPTTTSAHDFICYVADCGGTVKQIDPPFGRHVLTDYTPRDNLCFPIFGGITAEPNEWDIEFFYGGEPFQFIDQMGDA